MSSGRNIRLPPARPRPPATVTLELALDTIARCIPADNRAVRLEAPGGLLILVARGEEAEELSAAFDALKAARDAEDGPGEDGPT